MLFGDHLRAAAMESITVQRECGLEQWQLVVLTKATSFFSSSKFLSFFFLFPPFSAPHWRKKKERLPHSRSYQSKPPQNISGSSHMLVATLCWAIYIYSHVLQLSVWTQWTLCMLVHFNLPELLANYSLNMEEKICESGRACVSWTVGSMVHHGNHLLLSVSS